jgi:hypothetical protein
MFYHQMAQRSIRSRTCLATDIGYRTVLNLCTKHLVINNFAHACHKKTIMEDASMEDIRMLTCFWRSNQTHA